MHAQAKRVLQVCVGVCVLVYVDVNEGVCGCV